MKRAVSMVPVFLLLLLGCREDPAAPGAIDANQGPMLSATVFTGAFSVGGFDAADPARGGVWAFHGGSSLTEARNSLVSNYSGVSFTGIGDLNATVLGGLDIVVLSSGRTNTSDIEKLTAAEQEALLGFVAGGGCAILLPDNDSFGGSSTPAANASLIDPFGMLIDGTFWTWITATVIDPTASPITDGPFGQVTSFTQLVAGALTDVGPYGTALATNDGGFALAVIEPGAVGPGAGPVIVFSDVNTFGPSSGSNGGFGLSETLWLNTINFCLTPATPDERIESIKSDVGDLAGAGTLNQGESGSLTGKLSVAQKKISQGKIQAAIGVLGSFIFQVEAFVNSERLTPDAGQALIDAAQAVIDQLSA